MDGRHLGLFSNTLLGIENSTEMEIRGYWVFSIFSPDIYLTISRTY